MAKKNNPPKKERRKSPISPKLREVSSRLDDFCKEKEAIYVAGNHKVLKKARTYLQGLLINNQRKNMERIDHSIKHTSNYEGIQQFISNSTWDHRAVITQNYSDLNKILGSCDTVLNIDESCFTKKGKMSAGVARQYNGRLGKIDNCQVGVYSSVCKGTKSSLADFRLYLPQQWCQEKSRCKKAGIPIEHQTYKSKLEFAQELIDSAIENEVQFGWVAADGFYGRDTHFAQYIENKGLQYVLDVPDNFTFYLEHPHPYLPRRTTKKGPKYKRYRSKSEQTTAKELRCNLDKQTVWQEIFVRNTTMGELHLEAIRQKVYIWKNDRSSDVTCKWIVFTRNALTNETSTFISRSYGNHSLQTLVQRHSSRYWIERNFEDAKTSAGMADYQVRNWIGWHHHMSMVVLAMFFMFQERELELENNPVTDGLLSCPDIVDVLSVVLPRGNSNVDDIMHILEKRHLQRSRDIESKFRKQKLMTKIGKST